MLMIIYNPASDIGTTFKTPVICIAEAKKENFNEGWAQALAEMVAAQRFNQNDELEVSGIVTTGSIWQFRKLRKKDLTLEIVSYSALEDLQKVMNIVNWIFYEAKNILKQQSNL